MWHNASRFEHLEYIMPEQKSNESLKKQDIIIPKGCLSGALRVRFTYRKYARSNWFLCSDRGEFSFFKNRVYDSSVNALHVVLLNKSEQADDDFVYINTPTALYLIHLSTTRHVWTYSMLVYYYTNEKYDICW